MCVSLKNLVGPHIPRKRCNTYTCLSRKSIPVARSWWVSISLWFTSFCSRRCLSIPWPSNQFGPGTYPYRNCRQQRFMPNGWVVWKSWNDLYYTTTPSKPLVSDGAAEIFMRKLKGKHIWVPVLETLTSQLFSRGLINNRAKGEILARLLCILTIDLAREAMILEPQGMGFNFPFSDVVTLSKFIKYLLDDGVVVLSFSEATPPAN